MCTEVTVKKTIAVPAIPTGFAFSSASVEQWCGERDKAFIDGGYKKCVEQCVAHIVNHYGWNSGIIYVHFSNDTHYGWHKYECGGCEWKTTIHPWEDDETVQIGTLPVLTEDDTPTRPVGLIEAEYVAEAMPVEA